MQEFTYSAKTGKVDKGVIPGLLRGYRCELVKGEKTEFGSVVFVPETLEKYFQDRVDWWGDVGYEPFGIEKMNGWTPTYNAQFVGYFEEYIEDREEYVREIEL